MRLTRFAALALTGLLAAPLAPAAAAPGPGSPTAGDPYYPGYGNGGYDVRHYAIDLAYDVPSGHLAGDTTVRARASRGLSRFNLDLELRPRRAWVDGVPASWSRQGREVTVVPVEPLRRGQVFDVRLTYAGVPGDKGRGYLGGWTETRDGGFAAGEPEAATLWFPSNDHPVDKARYDVRVTTDATKDVVSNGTLVSREDLGDGLATSHWRTRDPMTTYLATVAIGDYEIREGTSPGGTPYVFAINEHLGRAVRTSATRSVARTPDIIDFYSRIFGAYPFETSGGIVVRPPIGFALENQTRPIYPGQFFTYGRNVGVIAHELAHQWFGDSVSLRRWHDTWLNEGFATWSASLWAAHDGGAGLTRQFRRNVRLMDRTDGWRTKVEPAPRGDIFDGAVYRRGGLTLQALRNRVGATTQERILRTWATRHRYGHGTTAAFVRLAERVSGADLGPFFRAWLHTPREPAHTRANGFPRSMR
ncbi:MAG: metallopeptidase [Nocardioides sp.]|nr:metallopeptidase [Nocardioides sp.]